MHPKMHVQFDSINSVEKRLTPLRDVIFQLPLRLAYNFFDRSCQNLRATHLARNLERAKKSAGTVPADFFEELAL